jgi:hypothetical protein
MQATRQGVNTKLAFLLKPGDNRRVRQALFTFLVAYCIFYVWVLVKVFHYYTTMFSMDIRDYDTRILVHECMKAARSGSIVLAISSFVAGAAFALLYFAVRQKKQGTSGKI